MKTLENEQCSYRKGIERTWKFSRFDSKVPGDFLFAPSRIDPRFSNPDGKKLVNYVIEEPNGFFSPTNLGYYHKIDFYDKILTVCPYSADWFNKKFNCNKWEYVFFPFNNDRVPEHVPKIYDVVYVGNIVSSEVNKWVSDFKKYNLNYKVISIHRYSETTDCDVDYDEKMKIISQSKVAVTHNILFPREEHMKAATNLYPDIISGNEAFKLCNGGKLDIVPQLKSRTFETAFGKTLMLCRKDPWNLIEDYFVPDEDFLYFEPGNLMPVLTEALKNYDNCQEMISRAYEKAVNNYTVEKFVDKYLVNLSL